MSDVSKPEQREGRWPMIVVHNGARSISVWRNDSDVDQAATMSMAEAGARILAYDDLLAALKAAAPIIADRAAGGRMVTQMNAAEMALRMIDAAITRATEAIANNLAIKRDGAA